MDNDIVGYIDQTTGQITGVGCLQCRIGKTFTSTVRRDKVFQHGKSLFEVCQNRVLDDLTAFCSRLLGFGHQTTHTRQLTNLILRTTSSRIQHHEYRIESLIVGRKLFHQNIGQTRIYMSPCIDNLIITLVISNETHVVVVHDLFHLGVTFGNQSLFFGRNEHITQIEGQTSLECHVVTQVLDIIKELSRTSHTANFNHLTDNIAQRFLRKDFIDIADLLRHILINQYTTHRRILDHVLDNITVLIDIFHNDRYRSVQRNFTFVVSDFGFFGTIEFQSFTQRTRAKFSNIIQSQNHILRRHSDRCTIGGVQDIMSTQHQQLSFKNSLISERQVNSHLVTVEVSVKCCTSERMQLDSLTFNHFGLERLNTQTVQRRGTVQQHGVSLHHMFEDIPYHRLFAIDDFLSRFYRLNDTTLDKFTDNKRFIQFGCHIFGQTAFVHFQFGTYDDNRTRRIIDTFTQQVLAETSLLTFQTIGKRL